MTEKQIADALGTEEVGAYLLEVARNARRAEQRLAAIVIYCEGVRDDFPEGKVWMDNILKLAGQNAS